MNQRTARETVSLINYASQEISCKVVYYGPGLGGKTTNIRYVYNKLRPEAKGKLISLATERICCSRGIEDHLSALNDACCTSEFLAAAESADLASMDAIMARRRNLLDRLTSRRTVVGFERRIWWSG